MIATRCGIEKKLQIGKTNGRFPVLRQHVVDPLPAGSSDNAAKIIREQFGCSADGTGNASERRNVGSMSMGA
jgi:hypothetical protein